MAQLLLEASALPCVLEEQHQIVQLLAAYDRWLVSLGYLLVSHWTQTVAENLSRCCIVDFWSKHIRAKLALSAVHGLAVGARFVAIPTISGNEISRTHLCVPHFIMRLLLCYLAGAWGDHQATVYLYPSGHQNPKLTELPALGVCGDHSSRP